MKVKQRNGHVTNSSSSSFIIAYKDGFGKLDEDTLSKYPFLESVSLLIQKSLFDDGKYDTDEAVMIETLEEWDDYWIEENKYYVNAYGDCWFHDKIKVSDIIAIFDRLTEEKGWNFDSEKQSYYEPRNKIEHGMKIMVKHVDYADKWLSDMISKMNNETDFIVIDRKG